MIAFHATASPYLQASHSTLNVRKVQKTLGSMWFNPTEDPSKDWVSQLVTAQVKKMRGWPLGLRLTSYMDDKADTSDYLSSPVASSSCSAKRMESPNVRLKQCIMFRCLQQQQQ